MCMLMSNSNTCHQVASPATAALKRRLMNLTRPHDALIDSDLPHNRPLHCRQPQQSKEPLQQEHWRENEGK